MPRRNINIFNIRTNRKKRVYIKSGCDYELDKGVKANKVFLNDDTFMQSLIKYIGQTITIFTVSGGESGSGFTGVLLDVKKDYIKILSRLSSPPSCSLGNCCEEEIPRDSCDNTSLGAITNIPVSKIAAFVHNTI